MRAGIACLRNRLTEGWDQRAFILKAASFAGIGVINSLIDLTVFLTAYSIFDLPLIPANLLAWLVAVSGSYVMNCFVTFAPESGRKLRWRSYGAFVLSGIAGVIATTATLVMASYWLSVIAAKLLAMGASFAVNFSLSHLVVFRRRQQRVETSTNGNSARNGSEDGVACATVLADAAERPGQERHPTESDSANSLALRTNGRSALEGRVKNRGNDYRNLSTPLATAAGPTATL